jgi:uncharacterized membrane protein
VGGFLLGGPFVLTEEVWIVAEKMHYYQTFITFLLVFVIGYGTLYEAAEEIAGRDEVDVAGVPNRFLSLIVVSYLSVILIVYLFSAPTVFEGGMFTTFKAIVIAALFSVVGAATADSVFEA